MSGAERESRGVRSARGAIHFEYDWPLGEAENRFFTALRDEGRLTAARCETCGRVMMPPRSFCEQCFDHQVIYEPAASTGALTTFAESYFSLDGKPLDEPFVLGIVRIDGTDGGLLHRLQPNGRKLAIGMRVRAVFAQERTGSILDILHFEPMGDEALADGLYTSRGGIRGSKA